MIEKKLGTNSRIQKKIVRRKIFFYERCLPVSWARA